MDDLIAAIRIKGMRDGLLVSLPEGEWDEQSAALLAQIDSQPTFFQGARVALEVGTQVLRVNEMVDLRDKLSERSVSLWAVISESPVTEQTAQLLGLATRVSKLRPEEQHSLDAGPVPHDMALFVNRTLRSGTRIEAQGSAVVVGDVNPGAELVAQGSVIVWGRLRGTVHAGSAGDRGAIICALELSPMRLQIAGEALEGSKIDQDEHARTASIRDGAIVLESWQPAGTGQA
ncbi:MAG TPA: septum site-determining protein MinC [Anaerolineales bacterium]